MSQDNNNNIHLRGVYLGGVLRRAIDKLLGRSQEIVTGDKAVLYEVLQNEMNTMELHWRYGSTIVAKMTAVEQQRVVQDTLNAGQLPEPHHSSNVSIAEDMWCLLIAVPESDCKRRFSKNIVAIEVIDHYEPYIDMTIQKVHCLSGAISEAISDVLTDQLELHPEEKVHTSLQGRPRPPIAR